MEEKESYHPELDLMDGASGEIREFAQEVEQQSRIASDFSCPLEERLDAFEDIIDSEVGDTSLIRARNVERELQLRQIYLKFEGGNPTGTQKDRIAFAQAKDALRRGFDTITVATCGNYGVAIALAASLSGLRCIIYIPENFKTKRIKEMTDLCAEIIRTSCDYEEAVKQSRVLASENAYYDANPGGVNTILQLNSYGGIASEIYDELRDAPYAIGVPVSNGTTLAGIYKGFLSLYRRGKTSRMPRIVAGSSFKKNPIVQSFQKNIPRCMDLIPTKIKETKINEPLINWHSIDGDHALAAIRDSQGWAFDISDKNMMKYAKLVREKEGLDTLPASVAGLVALDFKHKNEPLPNDRYVIILTGRKS